ncbi:Hypothetical predicted protein [Drosophila guanche]|uniref:Uncharacterized protein n=3 Tax=Drosophila guanche TaxID=7266 RepID=A0A3B0K3H2_DROGU|nr:Hypothetical predicted protein [Drosophila guanche]
MNKYPNIHKCTNTHGPIGILVFLVNSLWMNRMDRSVVVFCLFLCLLPDCMLATKEMENYVPERCRYLRSHEEVLQRKCSGHYPLVAVTKFRDTFIEAGEPFALYMTASLDYVLVLMKASPLHNCQKMRFLDVTSFNCGDKNNTVILKSAAMYCFPFHIQLPDDLMQMCLMENDMNLDPLKEVLKTKRGVIHYALGDNGAERLGLGIGIGIGVWLRLLALPLSISICMGMVMVMQRL